MKNEQFAFGEYQPKILFFKNVSNAHEIRGQILKGNFPCAAIKPRLVVDEFQVYTATQLALNSKSSQLMKTHSVYSEIIYNLSPNRKISDSLKRFGIDDNDSELICVILNDTDKEFVCGTVKGDLVHDFHDLTSSDPQELKKFYKVKDEELRISTISDAIINRITTKEIVSW